MERKLDEGKYVALLYSVYEKLAYEEAERGMVWKELPTTIRWKLEAHFSRDQTDSEHLEEQIRSGFL